MSVCSYIDLVVSNAILITLGIFFGRKRNNASCVLMLYTMVKLRDTSDYI